MMNFHFYNPTRLLFGSGKIGELGAQKLPGKKPCCSRPASPPRPQALWIRRWSS